MADDVVSGAGECRQEEVVGQDASGRDHDVFCGELHPCLGRRVHGGNALPELDGSLGVSIVKKKVRVDDLLVGGKLLELRQPNGTNDGS